MAAGERETAASADVGLSCLVGRSTGARDEAFFATGITRRRRLNAKPRYPTKPNPTPTRVEHFVFASPHDSFFAAR